MAQIDVLVDVLKSIATGSAKSSTGGDLKATLAAALSGLNLTGSASLDFASANAGLSADLTIAVPGAVLGDVVALGVPNAAVVANSSFSAFVSAADVVTVRFNNHSAGALNPAAGVFTVKVVK